MLKGCQFSCAKRERKKQRPDLNGLGIYGCLLVGGERVGAQKEASRSMSAQKRSTDFFIHGLSHSRLLSFTASLIHGFSHSLANKLNHQGTVPYALSPRTVIPTHKTHANDKLHILDLPSGGLHFTCKDSLRVFVLSWDARQTTLKTNNPFLPRVFLGPCHSSANSGT